MLALVAAAAPAAAQSVLVSNFGQTHEGNSPVASFDLAQGFTTGSNTHGYTLASVDLNFSPGAPSGLTVAIATGLPSATTVVATLTNPTLSANTLTFTAPANTVLSAGTTYFVVIEGSGHVRNTKDTDEDDGAAAGWSIADKALFRAAASTGAWSDDAVARLLRVNGTVNTSAPVTGPPTVSSAEVNGKTLTLTFSDALTTTAAPTGNGGFTVGGKSPAPTVSSVAFRDGDATKVDLTLSTAIRLTDTGITVSYTAPATNPLTSALGDVANFSGQSVTNVTGPSVSSAEVDGDELTITFDVSLNTTAAPEAKRFTVGGRTETTTVTGVALDGTANRNVTLTLSPAVKPDESGITVDYEAGDDANPLKRLAHGHLVADFTGQAVTNATPFGPTSVEGNGNKATITFNGDLKTDDGTPGAGTFTLTGSPANVNAVAFKTGDATKVELTLSPALAPDEPHTLSLLYNRGTDAKPFRRANGANVADFIAGVTNLTPPTVTTVPPPTVNGAALTLTFNGTLSTEMAPATSAFTVSVAGTASTVTAVSIPSAAPTTVILTLGTAVGPAETGAITVGYTQPAANPLTSTTGNKVATFTAQTVTNATPPTVTTVPPPTVNGAVLTIPFNHALNTTTQPDVNSFTVSVGSSGTLRLLSSAAFKTGDPTRVELTLSEEMTAAVTATILVQYEPPNDATALKGADPNGNKVAAFSEMVSNVTPLMVETAWVNGTALTIMFDAPLVPTTTPDKGSFTVAGTAATTTVTAVEIPTDAAKTVILTLSAAVGPNERGITVDYTKPATNPLTGSNGSEVATFTGRGVANATPLAVKGATVNGMALTLTFDGKLRVVNGVQLRPPPGDDRFTVMVGTTERALRPGVTYTSDQTGVLMQLAAAVGPDESGITVSYDGSGDASPLQSDGNPNDVPAFENQTVTNLTPPAVTSAVVQGTALTITFNGVLRSTHLSGVIEVFRPPPATSRFTVGGTVATTTVTNVAFSDDRTELELTLSAAVGPNETGITVSYEAGSDANPLQGRTNQTNVVDFTNQSVKNGATPEPTSATVNGNRLILTFTGDLKSTTDGTNPISRPPPAVTSFSVSRTETTVTHAQYAAGNQVWLTLSADVGPDESGFTVDYTGVADADPNPLQGTTGNAVADFSAQSVTNATPPAPTAATVEGATLTLTFNGMLDTSAPPAAGSFTLAGTAATISSVAFNAGDATKTMVELTLNPAVGPGESGIKVSYDGSADPNPLKGTRGHNVAVFTEQPVANAASPSFTAASVNGSTLTLTFTAALNTDRTPAANNFTVMVGTTARAVSSVAFKTGEATMVELTLNPAAGPDESGITVSYTAGTNPLKGTNDNAVANFAARTVTNLTPPAPTDATVEGTTLTLTFNGNLDTSTPPAAGSFSVGGRTATTVSAPAFKTGDATMLELTLSPAVGPTETGITLSYTAGTNPLKGLTNQTNVEDFTRSVRNLLRTGPIFPPNAPSTLSVRENSGAGTAVGTVAATDPRRGVLTYTLASTADGGTDHEPFAIGANTGAITVRSGARLDYETKTRYAVTVTASDGTSSASRDVTIRVRNVLEPPSRPGAPTVERASETSLSVSWSAPSNAGARAVTDYDLRYYEGTADPSNASDWIEEGEANGPPNPGASTSATISDLTENGAYRVQVRAQGDGESPWSESGAVGGSGGGGGGGGGGGTANRAPAFASTEYAFDLPENLDGSGLRGVELGVVSATDPDGDALTYDLAAGDPTRFAVDARDGTVLYTGPGEDFETLPNVYELTVRATDPAGETAEADVVVTVVNVVELPRAVDDAATTDEDVAITVPVLANDSDPEGTGLGVASVSAPENGTADIVAGAAGGVLYTPAPNWHGTDRFTYSIEDGNGATSEAAVEVTVRPVNDAPEPADDEAATDEDTAVEVPVLANDTDIDGDSLRVASVSGAANGTVAVVAGGVRYTPAANWHGTDRFTYVADDGNGGTAEAAVEVTVRPVNDAPEAADDEAATNEDVPVTVDVLANDTDADGDGLRVASVTAPENGTAAITAGGVLYTPAPNWHGTDRFTYSIEDGNGATSEASVEVTVTPVNDGPTAVGTIPQQALEEGGEPGRIELGPFFADADGDALVYAASSSDSSVVRATVSGSVLTLVPVGYGTVVVAVAAWDPNRLMATQAVAVRASDRPAREVVSHAMAGLARSHLASARMTLGRRATASRTEASRLTLMGREVPLGAESARSAAEQMWAGWLSGVTSRAYSQAAPYANAGSPGGSGGSGSDMTLGDLFRFGDLVRFQGGRDPLRGSEFLFSLGGAQEADGGRGLRFQLWGQGDVQTFEGAPTDAGDYDGSLTTGYVGVDTWLSDRWLAGVAVARSRGASDWRAGGASGSLETRLIAVHPYLQWSNGATSVWATAGGGWGDADNVRDSGHSETSGLQLRLGLVELRRRLAAGGGFELGLRADAAWAELATDIGTQTLDSQAAAVNQARLGADLSQQIRLGGLALTPFGEAHVRRDGGAGQPGTGLELIGGLRARAGFLRIDAQGRMLAVHSVAGYEERGAGITLSLGNAGGEGPSLSVSPRWGDLATGGDALWRDQIQSRYAGVGPRGEPAANARDPWTLDVRGDYGMRLPGGRLLTWSASMNPSPEGPRFTLGGQLGAGGLIGSDDASGTETAPGDRMP